MSKLIIDYKEEKSPDFIGDIHGHYDALIQLFEKMGYSFENGVYIHPERFPVFIGDYIDRGPKIFETVDLVKRMQESANAIALMGNHELNYLELHYKDEFGNFLRSQSKRNQVQETDAAFNGKDKNIYLEWMSKLPIAINSEHFRAVHAQWDDEAIENIKSCNIEILDQFGLQNAHKKTYLYKSIEVLLKGKEVSLPEDLHYSDYGATIRTEARIKWWKPQTKNRFGDDFASLPEHLKDKDISNININYDSYYSETEKPVFFGHYWMDKDSVELMSANTCCVDYSIAKRGVLVAYRHKIGEKLNNRNFINHI